MTANNWLLVGLIVAVLFSGWRIVAAIHWLRRSLEAFAQTYTSSVVDVDRTPMFAPIRAARGLDFIANYLHEEGVRRREMEDYRE